MLHFLPYIKILPGKPFCVLLRKLYVTKLGARPVQWKVHRFTFLPPVQNLNSNRNTFYNFSTLLVNKLKYPGHLICPRT